MAKTNASASLNNPARLKAFSKKKDNEIQVIVETPKGSRNKYAFDPEQRIFELSKVLPEGMVFPYDFGFVPSTKAEDGDPLDVLILLDESVSVGCLVKCRVVGVIEGEQSGKDETVRNDRVLAVAKEAHTYAKIKDVQDLGKNMLSELEHFFTAYHDLRGEKYTVLGCKGADKALKLIRKLQVRR